MPPARPVDIYGRCYTGTPAATSPPAPQRRPRRRWGAGGEKAQWHVVCSKKRETPPGKPVASKIQKTEVNPDQFPNSNRHTIMNNNHEQNGEDELPAARRTAYALGQTEGAGTGGGRGRIGRIAEGPAGSRGGRDPGSPTEGSGPQCPAAGTVALDPRGRRAAVGRTRTGPPACRRTEPGPTVVAEPHDDPRADRLPVGDRRADFALDQHLEGGRQSRSGQGDGSPDISLLGNSRPSEA